MADAVLEVGAVIDLTQILPGMEKMAASTMAATSQMSTSFQSLPATAVPSMSELNASIERLIASNLRVADSSAAMAGAVMGSMAKTSAAVTAGSTGAVASLENLKREMASVAGSAEISARGTMAAFGPLGMLFGVGIAAHYAEGLKDVILQLDRMSASSGVSVSQLAQFKGALESMGVPSENMSRLFLHMTMQMKAAHDGVTGSVNAFKQLGISTEEWSKTMPNALDLLLKMSDYMHAHKDTMDVTGAAAKILGARLGVELVGAMSQGSEVLKKYMAQHKELGDQMQAAVMDARRLQEAEAEASAAIKSAMVPLMGFMADFLNVAHALWLGLKYDVLDAFAGIKLGVEDTILAFQTFARVSYDIARFDWSAAKADVKSYFDTTAKNAADAAAKIAAHNKEISEAGFKITDKPKPPVPGTEEPDVIAKAKKGASTRMEVWRDTLNTMKADADSFHAVTAADEVAYWEGILAREKLSTKERVAIQRELNHAKHAAAMEAFSEQVAVDHELISTAREGSAERLALVIKDRDFIVSKWGEGSKQAMTADRAVLEEMKKVNLAQAEDVVKSVATQVESYKAGSKERIEIVARAIAALKVMEDNLAAGKTAAGKAEPAGKLAPTGAEDVAVRLHVREDETAKIQKLVDDLTARLMGDYRAEGETATREVIRIERERLASIARTGRAQDETVAVSQRTTDELIRQAREEAEAESSAIRKSSDERIKVIERMEGYDLITYSRRIALTRAILDDEERAVTREIASKIELMRADEEMTLRKLANIKAVDEAEGNEGAARAVGDEMISVQQMTNEKIMGLQRQLGEAYVQLGLKRQRVDDEAAEHEMARASQAAGVIGAAFGSTFERMTRERLTFQQTMVGFWNDIVAGFARMGDQIIAKWIKTLTTKLLLNVLHLGQTQALETAETTAHVAQVETRAAATAVGQAQETSATAAGAGTRTSLGILESIGSIMRAAAVAAAHAFKSVMEALPWPINVAVAAGVAAGTFFAVKAFAGKLSSAAGGMVAEEDQIVRVHAQETILPADLSRGFRDIIAAGSFAAPAAMRTSFGSHPATAGGGVTNRNTTMRLTYAPVIHAGDEVSWERRLRDHADDVGEIVRQQIRKGALPSL